MASPGGSTPALPSQIADTEPGRTRQPVRFTGYEPISPQAAQPTPGQRNPSRATCFQVGSASACEREREPQDAEHADDKDGDQHRGHPAGDKTGHQQDGG
jgi:hypothetical protein